MLSLDSYLPIPTFSEGLEQQQAPELYDAAAAMAAVVGDQGENSPHNHHHPYHHQQQLQQQQQLPQQQRFLAKSLSFGGSSGDPELMLEGSVKDSLFAKFLPSNNDDEAFVDAYSCDEFRMYEFKVRRCMRGRSHDWTECPFAHPGEKARRRDPRRFHYSGTACPDFRKGTCRRGDACEFAHGVFECWLHPARYRTQPCKDGRNCKRRVCFFAHTPQQLRVLAAGSSGNSPTSTPSKASSGKTALAAALASSPASSLRHIGLESFLAFDSSGSPRGYVKSNLSTSSPTSTLVGHSQSPPPLSPPLSPTNSPRDSLQQFQKSPMAYDSAAAASGSASFGFQSLRRHPSITIPAVSQDSRGLPSPVSSMSNESPKLFSDLISSLQNLELNGNASAVGVRPWLQAQTSASPFVHSPPRSSSNLRHCSYSLPCTPTKSSWEPVIWEQDLMEEPPQRVESGRDLRAQIYGRLKRETSEVNSSSNNADSPDLAWVNDLVK